MALTKSTAARVADLRVDWPELPEMASLQPSEEKALREWYQHLRQSVDRTIEALNRAIEKAAATT